MSRIGKKPISIPDKTEVNVSQGKVSVKGPLGELSRSFKPDINIKIEGKEITLEPVKITNESSMLWGTYASHITNMIKGVNQ